MTKELQNLAWSLLPKELKEEVKEQFRDGFNDDRDVIGRLFGVDNLLSDAEEEEMLIIPRRKVQELYGQLGADAIANREVGEEGFVLSGIAQQVALFTLFGDKCLKK